ncbi:hypothetical protein DBV05_g3301 [Lasiodiplodia theobromae]|uniref:Zn(2)-C6 fungal-type domain-containing protein n=1 Tax=Lasiodiplodia theobromae TaxID=45133 RepID=A0A5N5DJS3_9PEZI|nr:hypothetical protein DBV05_g3301 [Lasiodiplodia theobromae]
MDHHAGSPQQVETVRTCQNCAHAKIRCLRSQPAGACDRCRRLRKDCVFRPARRRFGGGGGGSGGGSAHHPAPPLLGSAATTTTTTIASIGDGFGNGAAAAAVANEGSQQQQQHQLASIEAKLDRLLSLHHGGNGSTGQASATSFYNAPRPPSSSSPASSYNPPTVPASCSSSTTAVHPPLEARSNSVAGASTHSASGDIIDDGILSLKQAQHCIQLYRTALTPHFPFVVLDDADGDDDDDAVMQRLRRERPFLFLAVVTAASFEDVGVQRECGRRLREVVGERVAGRGGGRGRRNAGVDVDFLMGLLVGLAW